MGAYGERSDDFRERDVRLVALTSEGEEKARAMVEDEDLPFQVLHSVDVDRVEEALGLWVSRGERTFFHPAQILLEPDGTVAQACYQSGPRGRMRPEDALGLVESLRKG